MVIIAEATAAGQFVGQCSTCCRMNRRCQRRRAA
jgi:hypothetical protein